jgi:ribonuclease R
MPGGDIFIPKHLTQNAIDGDLVEVALSEGPVSEKGPEGRIVAIITRARTHLAGTVWTIDDQIKIYAPLMGTSRRVVVRPPEDRHLCVGDRLILKVVDWGAPETETLCEMVHYLGNISDASTDVPAAIEEFELRKDFSEPQLREAAAFGTEVNDQDLGGRADYRQLETVTIDPDTAKDFDDALSIERLNGGWRLYVHIADVSHYVREGSLLDQEARLRSNSTYFPGVCIPMLPHQLADNLCSLKPNVVRLTITVVMEFDGAGQMQGYGIYRSAIRSQQRFTYAEARAILNGADHPHAQVVRDLAQLSLLLTAQRQQRGSITLAMTSCSVRIDERGNPLGLEFEEYDLSHQMVEEFMLKANELVALHLASQHKELSYRVHEEPSPEDIQAFVEEARSYGLELRDNPSAQDLQQALSEATKQPWGRQLTTRFIRSLKLAFYSPHNVGHFGLALQHYCHFTSPIRRYVDLVIHRLLFEQPISLDQLKRLSEGASTQERVSSRAEMAVSTLKKLRLLQANEQANPGSSYRAVVTSVRPSGISFEVVDWMLDGSIHVSQLSTEYYTYDARRRLLRAPSGTFRLGDPIEVMISSLDLITLEVRWHIMGQQPSQERGGREKERAHRPRGRAERNKSRRRRKK